MKILAQIVLLLCFLFAPVSAQEEKKDTLNAFEQNSNIEFYLSEDFELYLPHYDFTRFEADESNIKLYSSYMVSEGLKQNLWNVKNEFDFLSNYHEFYIRNSKVSPITYILGMAQAGAVGYLAYRHIKKYGLR